MPTPGRSFPCLCGFRSTTKLDELRAELADVREHDPFRRRAVRPDHGSRLGQLRHKVMHFYP